MDVSEERACQRRIAELDEQLAQRDRPFLRFRLQQDTVYPRFTCRAIRFTL
jgi:hypothetical protein